MNQEKTYTIEFDENHLEFIRRVIADQPDREPLRIVEQLVEIAVGELKDRPYELSAVASEKRLVVTLRHGGKPIDERMVWLMDDQIDRAKYKPDGDSWVLTLRRDIPSFYINHEDD